MSRHARIFVLIAISAVWLAMVSLLAHCFNVPSAGGILYSLPFATAKHPFDLGVPFLEDFDGYGSSWGHQWPGTMWLRGLVFLIVPYSRLADVAVLSCFQLLAAFTAASLVWRFTCRRLPSLATLSVLLSDRLLLLSCAGNRIEAPAAAAILLLFAATVRLKGQATGRWPWIEAVAAFFCASKWDSRRRYEDLASCHARPSDILILDQDAAGHPDRFGLHPTFNINPPDAAKWRPLRFHKQMLPGSIPWGINLSVFERLP